MKVGMRSHTGVHTLWSMTHSRQYRFSLIVVALPSLPLSPLLAGCTTNQACQFFQLVGGEEI